jgi:hypothetical protein
LGDLNLPDKDRRGVDLISAALPFGRLWYAEPNAVSNAIAYSLHYSRSHPAVIRVHDDAGNVIETHEHAGCVQRAMSSGPPLAPAGAVAELSALFGAP